VTFSTAPDSQDEYLSTALTREFWEASALGRLVRPVCNDCGHNFFTPSVVCPECLSQDWTYQESHGRGVVYSHTTVFRGPDDSWPVPYVLAIIDMNEGWTMLSRLIVDPPDESIPGSLIGMPVRATFVLEDRAPHRMLPVFTLAEVSP
jgi:uncharacterized OB-fold protein